MKIESLFNQHSNYLVDTWVLPPLQIWVSMAFGDWDTCTAFPSKFDLLKLGSLS